MRAGAHAFEAKVFNVVSAAYLDTTIEEAIAPLGSAAVRTLKETPAGVSMILGPQAEQIGETLCDDEGLLYADIDLAQSVEPKQFHDVVGYYNRFDIFKMSVNNEARNPIDLSDLGGGRGYTFEEIEARFEQERPPEALAE